MFLKVHGIGSSQFLCEIQTLLFSVHSHNPVDAHGAQDGNADQPDGSAALYHHSAVEPQYSRTLGPLHSMDQHCAGFNEHSGIQVQIAYVKHGGAFPYQNIVGKPSVQVNIVVRKQAVHIGAAHILLIQVKHGDIRVILENHAGNHFVAKL